MYDPWSTPIITCTFKKIDIWCNHLGIHWSSIMPVCHFFMVIPPSPYLLIPQRLSILEFNVSTIRMWSKHILKTGFLGHHHPFVCYFHFFVPQMVWILRIMMTECCSAACNTRLYIQSVLSSYARELPLPPTVYCCCCCCCVGPVLS